MDFRHSILLSKELSNPAEEFVRYFAKKAYPSVVTQKEPGQFSTITKRAFNLIVSDLINHRLKPALKTETAKARPLTGEQPDKQETKPENGIETTQEEIEASLIVKSVLRQKIDLQRIHLRDAQSYCAILFDDNNRKPICRLYFNGKKKFVDIPDESKKFVRNEIQVLDDIFGLGDKLMEVVEGYEGSISALRY